ncbi:MAG: phosphopantothenoylcysteine decarboxylase [Phycisphaerales bacterium]|nr:phosphopantothenoylcysteine decarboxylase [Phycisphaerales bacterium]
MDHSIDRILITAGPTHEPIDAVRYIANRSSGRLGIDLAESAARQGRPVTLLLGPTALHPNNTQIETIRFRTTADLEAALAEHLPRAGVLIMAAAVADYRPRRAPGDLQSKRRRTKEGMTLELEATPDLLAGCAHQRAEARRENELFIVGFALEPREEMLASAKAKLTRKGVDLIVANPLETMDAPTIEASLVAAEGVLATTGGKVSKAAFAEWLLEAIERARVARRGASLQACERPGE